MSRVRNFVVIYDIHSDSNRSRVARILYEFGVRTQLSVFEIEVSPNKYQSLIKRLERRIRHKSDKIYIYPLDAEGAKSIDRFGKTLGLTVNDFFV